MKNAEHRNLVALAAIQRRAAKTEKVGRAKRRADRRSAKLDLRKGNY